jgi:hypothetical protein
MPVGLAIALDIFSPEANQINGARPEKVFG